MSFSDRRRDSGEGRRVDGKYIPSEITDVEILGPDALAIASQC